jgi:hypothetical protein
VLLIRTLRNLWLFISLGLSTLALPQNSFAALIDVQQKNDIVYFLFAAPNKIVRYDLNSNEFLAKISLAKIPTAFHVGETKIYTSYGKDLTQSDISGNSSSSIFQAVNEIRNLTLLGNYLYSVNSDNRINIISTDTHTEIENRYYSSNATDLIASPTQQSIFSVENYTYTPRKVTLDNSGTITHRIHSELRSSSPHPSNVYLHPSENNIYTDKGFIYSTDDLSFRGTLTGSFTDMTFLDNRPIVIRENNVFIYSDNNLDSKSFILDHMPSHVAAKDQIITSFVTTSSLVSAHQTNIDQLVKPTATPTKNPATSVYQTDLITTNEDNIVYLVDKENLAIHRRKAEEKEFASSWGLVEAPNWITYSASHKRLYLGYESGKITYFDTTKTGDTEEVHFISLTNAIRALVSAGDYLFAKDVRYSSYTNSYSIDEQGIIIDHTGNGETSEEYVWNHLNDYVYQISNRHIRWTELLSSDGNFGVYQSGNYNSDSNYKFPLRISPNGQILLLGSGEIIGTNNQATLNNLSNSIDDATWINGKLATIKKDTNTLQFWQEDYLLTSEHQLSKTQNTRLFNLKEKLLIVKQSDTRPIFIYTDVVTISDSDDDTINDFDDNCEFTSNKEQADLDQDDIGDVCDEDSDNDLIPNTVEVAAGLDALNKDDAWLDLDGDGFNNFAEYLYTTNINDSESTPEAIATLAETFDSGIPKGMYSLNPNNLLVIIQEEDNHYLSTFVPQDPDQSTSFYYTGNFDQGLLELRYYLDGYRNYTLDIIIDGEAENPRNIYGGWETISLNLDSGAHTIEFRFTFSSESNSPIPYNHLLKIDYMNYGLDSDSDKILDALDNCPLVSNNYQHDSDNDGLGNECDNDPYGQDKDSDGYGDNRDNCPDTYNPDQLNIDNDYYGDACDDVDDRPSDVDQDGIPDYSDNCPNTANPEQENFDLDYLGDSCDLDSDNDGLLNTVEDQYDFLNAFDATDAYLDFDNDGAINQYELNNDLPADEANTFEAINLLEYYPVGDLDYFYVSDNQFIRTSMETTEVPGRFKLSFSNDTQWFIERRNSGVYLISYTDLKNEVSYSFENYLILPNSLKPGHKFTSAGKQIREGASDYSDAENTFYLKEIGEKAWRDKTYPAITIMVNGVERVYLKGIGELSYLQLELDSVNFDFIEKPEVVAPEQSKAKAGALAPFIFFLFYIMAMATRVRRK